MTPDMEFKQLLSKKTKPQIIEYCENLSKEFTETKTRIIHNYEEETQNRLNLANRKVERIKRQMLKVFPNTDMFSKYNMFYFRKSNMNDGTFSIAKKDKLTFDKYQLGRQIYYLPDELKVKELMVTLLAIFDINHKFVDYGVLNCRMEDIYTFHTNPFSVCLGENVKAKEIVDFEKPETILEGFGEMKSTLETINPDSLLIGDRSLMPRKLHNTLIFVRNKSKEYHEANDEEPNDEEECPDCGELLENCHCNTCDDCNRHIDDCECDKCPNCGLRIHSHNYDECNCQRCRNCGEIKDGCECIEFDKCEKPNKNEQSGG